MKRLLLPFAYLYSVLKPFSNDVYLWTAFNMLM